MPARTFFSREHAGRLLAWRMDQWRDSDPVVVGLPGGGVPVAIEIARELRAPLDVWLVRELAVPWHVDRIFGAVAETGWVYLSPQTIRRSGISDDVLAFIVHFRQIELARKVVEFRGVGGRAPDLRGKTVILVDDGIETGACVRAAVQSIRVRKPKSIVLAVPAGPRGLVDQLRDEVDELEVLRCSRSFVDLSQWYEKFPSVTDGDARRLLSQNGHLVHHSTQSR